MMTGECWLPVGVLGEVVSLLSEDPDVETIDGVRSLREGLGREDVVSSPISSTVTASTISQSCPDLPLASHARLGSSSMTACFRRSSWLCRDMQGARYSMAAFPPSFEVDKPLDIIQEPRAFFPYHSA